MLTRKNANYDEDEMRVAIFSSRSNLSLKPHFIVISFLSTPLVLDRFALTH